MADASSPLKYLSGSSTQSIEAFELSRLNRVANLRKQIMQLMDDCIESGGEAWLARCMMEQRRAAESRAGVPPLLDPAPSPQLSLDLREALLRDATLDCSSEVFKEASSAPAELPAATQSQELALRDPAPKATLTLFPEAIALCVPEPGGSAEPFATAAAQPETAIAPVPGKKSADAARRACASKQPVVIFEKALLRMAPNKEEKSFTRAHGIRERKCACG